MHLTELTPAIIQLLLFLSRNRQGLANAALLLGGKRALNCFHRLLEDLSGPEPRITERVMDELFWLHGLLSLEDAADTDIPEAAQFALMDPEDPCVEEICLLTDELGHCIKRLIAEPAPSTLSKTLAA